MEITDFCSEIFDRVNTGQLYFNEEKVELITELYFHALAEQLLILSIGYVVEQTKKPLFASVKGNDPRQIALIALRLKNRRN